MGQLVDIDVGVASEMYFMGFKLLKTGLDWTELVD